MTHRRLLIAAGATAGAIGLVLIAGPAAGAVDVWGNVAPASQLPAGSLADAYPLANYALDHHFKAIEAGVLSGVDVSGLAPTVAWIIASLIWQLTALLANAVITLFTFAFSLDLVNGSPATGGNGALAPVAEAVQSIYRDVFGAPWLTVAVVLCGMWSMWHALVRRRYVETASALGLSVLYIVIALAIVTQPERTIGQASRWSNDVSVAFLSLSADGSLSAQQQTKQDASDHLFELLIYQPWVVLQFGGLEHCVRDGDAVRVRPLSPDARRDAQLARQLAAGRQIDADGKTCVNHRTKYAPHFLRFAPDTDQRNAEHDALKNGDTGKLPDEDPGKHDGSYQLSSVDKVAAEAMGKSGQYQRVGIAIVILVAELGAFLLLGSLAVAVILAQVLVLLLVAFAPVALVVGTFPGRGHQFFLDWLLRLAAFLVKKAAYSLVLAILLAVSGALQDATATLGWLMAFGLQAVFFWAVYLGRHQLVGQLTQTVTGRSGARDERQLLAGIGVAYAATRIARRSWGAVHKATRKTAETIVNSRTHAHGNEPSPTPPKPLAPRRRHNDNDPGRDDDGPRDDSGPGRDRDGGHDGEPAGPTTPPTSPPSSGETTPGAAAAAPRAAAPGRDRTSHPAPAQQAPETGAQHPARSTDTPAATGTEPTTPTAPTPTTEPAPPAGRSSDGATARPASASASTASSAGSARAGENPLLAGIREDARRLRRDADRMHEDTRSLRRQLDSDTTATEPPSAPPRHRAPRPSRAPGSRGTA